jgi:hypothetical protein
MVKATTLQTRCFIDSGRPSRRHEVNLTHHRDQGRDIHQASDRAGAGAAIAGCDSPTKPWAHPFPISSKGVFAGTATWKVIVDRRAGGGNTGPAQPAVWLMPKPDRTGDQPGHRFTALKWNTAELPALQKRNPAIGGVPYYT